MLRAGMLETPAAPGIYRGLLPEVALSGGGRVRGRRGGEPNHTHGAKRECGSRRGKTQNTPLRTQASSVCPEGQEQDMGLETQTGD